MMAWRLGCLAAIVLTASASITYLEPVWEEQDPLPWMRPTLRKVPASTTRRHLTPLQTNQALKASQRMVEIAERRGKMQPQGIKALAAQDDVCTKRGCTAKATSRRKRAALSCKRSFFKGTLASISPHTWQATRPPDPSCVVMVGVYGLT